jgi:hypothetical protein
MRAKSFTMNAGDQKKEIEGKQVVTISISRANKVALLLAVPIAAVWAIPYYIIWGVNVIGQISFPSLGFLFIFIIAGIVFHELLHGITWAAFAKNGFRSIHFGIKWEYLTPFCHCTEALRVWQYILGGLMPLLIMGIIPSAWAMIEGNAMLMFYGIFFCVAAGGDMQSVWLLRRFNPNQLVYDHPEELGFILEDNHKL